MISNPKKRHINEVFKTFSNEKATQARFNIIPRNSGKQFPGLRQSNFMIFSDFYINPKITKLNIQKIDIYSCSNKNFQNFQKSCGL